MTSLKLIGVTAAEKGLEIATSQAASSLGWVGKVIANNSELKDAASETAKGLITIRKCCKATS